MPTVAELAQQELSRRYSLQGRTQLSPRVQTMQNARPTVRSALSNLMRDAVDATGLEGGYRQGLLNAAEGVETAADFLPVVGDVLGLEDASRAYGQGDMVGAGINMLGAVPIIGDVAAKAARSSLRNIYHGTSPDAAKAIDQFGFDLGKTADGSAWFTTNPDIGEVAAAGKGGVIQRQLDESNLKLASYDETDKYLKDQLIDMGYDGAYYPDAQDGSTHYEIWNQDKLNKLSPLSGLDMNPEARMQRAKDLGFDTTRTAYRGISGNYNPEKSGYYQMFTSSPQDAQEYGSNVISAYTRKGKNLSLDAGKRNFNDIPVEILPENVRKNLHYTLNEPNSVLRTDDIAHAAREAGYDSVTINNVFDKASNEIPIKPLPASNEPMSQEMIDILDEVNASGMLDSTPDVALPPEIPRDYEPATIDIIFDPKNIRSTEAEFDPAKMGSADLLSSVGATSALRGVA